MGIVLFYCKQDLTQLTFTCSKSSLSVFTVNFEHILHLFLVFLLLTLNK